jgi:hypothetical protein
VKVPQFWHSKSAIVVVIRLPAQPTIINFGCQQVPVALCIATNYWSFVISSLMIQSTYVANEVMITMVESDV